MEGEVVELHESGSVFRQAAMHAQYCIVTCRSIHTIADWKGRVLNSTSPAVDSLRLQCMHSTVESLAEAFTPLEERHKHGKEKERGVT